MSQKIFYFYLGLGHVTISPSVVNLNFAISACVHTCRLRNDIHKVLWIVNFARSQELCLKI